MKNWATEQVAKDHGYLNTLESHPGHQEFARYLEQMEFRPIVLDIGCGNGRVLLDIEPYVSAYIGIDYNPFVIERAKEFFPNHTFICSEPTILPDLTWDKVIVYFDSTLPMIEDFQTVLANLKTKNPFSFYFGRTSFTTELNNEIGYHRWAGMTSDSILWKISKPWMDSAMFPWKTNDSIRWTKESKYVC